MTIASIENTEKGVIVHVNKTSHGYSVTVQDADSGAFLPSAKFYPIKAAAMAYATSVATGKEPCR